MPHLVCGNNWLHVWMIRRGKGGVNQKKFNQAAHSKEPPMARQQK
jgi:hypothetical protein